MVRGLILSSPTLTASTLLASFSFSKTHPKCFKLSLPSTLLHHHHHPQPCILPLVCCFCVSSSPTTQCPIDMSNYRDAFSSRMAMAGLKPHHRIGPKLQTFEKVAKHN